MIAWRGRWSVAWRTTYDERAIIAPSPSSSRAVLSTAITSDCQTSTVFGAPPDPTVFPVNWATFVDESDNDGSMFDLDDFVGRCRQALKETEPRIAIREELARAVAVPITVADALAPTDAGFSILHHAPDMTILHVVWAPKMTIYPHNHRMWAAIGIYAGQEDNAFYRRSGPGERTLV